MVNCGNRGGHIIEQVRYYKNSLTIWFCVLTNGGP